MPRRSRAPQNFKQGDDGQRFFVSHIQDLLKGTVWQYKIVSSEQVGGADVQLTIAEAGEAREHSDPEEMGEHRIVSATKTDIKRLIVGYAEIKTVWNCLFRTNDRADPSGTLGFELWSSSGGDGWLPQYMNPNKYHFKQVKDRPKVVQPLVLAFLLMAYDMPFACVAFEDIPALFGRLREIGKELGIDPEHPSRDSDTYKPDLLIIENMWHVPISRLVDLATVTLIGDMPLLRPDIQETDGRIGCSHELQQQRYEYLATRAGERKIGQDAAFSGTFTLSLEQQAYANAAFNLAVLQSLDEAQYPTLVFCQQNYKFRETFKKLTAVLKCMLATAKPRRGRFFLISHDFLIGWCRHHDLTASKRSVQGALKFLEDCGLLTASSETNGRGRPTTLLAADRYDDAVLDRAEATAKVYVDSNVSIAKMTNATIISVRGADVAHELYHDRREIPHKQAYTRKLFQDEVLRQIEERGYALKEEALDRTREALEIKKGFVFIDPFKDLDASEIREMKRQQDYNRALDKVKDQLPLILNEIGCVYRQARKAEKTRFGLPSWWRQWVIVKR